MGGKNYMTILAIITTLTSLVLLIGIYVAARKETMASMFIGYLIFMCLVSLEFIFSLLYMLNR